MTQRQMIWAYILLVVIHLSLKFGSVRCTQTWLSRFSELVSQINFRSPNISTQRQGYCGQSPQLMQRCLASQDGSPLLQNFRSTLQAVKLASHYAPWATCLRRSLVLWFLLRCQQIDTQLRFGIRREGQQIQGHTWVEYQGQVLNDRPHIINQYTVSQYNCLE
jgi:hypothetical protein